MTNPNISIDSASLIAFTATLANLPADEIRKAKKLYLLNAIVDFQAQKQGMTTMLVIFGILSIIPVFWIVTIPAFITSRKALALSRQKILNAAEIWRDDLGADYQNIYQQIQSL